jgi:hypothetical protein
MPNVGGKKYSYDKKGIAAAKKAAVAQMLGKPYPMAVNEKSLKGK